MSAGLEYGAGTFEGEGEACTLRPPSKRQTCSREYLPFRNSGPVFFQMMDALCSAIAHQNERLLPFNSNPRAVRRTPPVISSDQRPIWPRYNNESTAPCHSREMLPTHRSAKGT